MMAAAGIQPNFGLQAPANDLSRETEDPYVWILKDICGFIFQLTNYRSPLMTSAQESPDNVLNPLAIYRMARTALHEKDSQSSASHSPSTQNSASPIFASGPIHFQSRPRPQVQAPAETCDHNGEQSHGSLQGSNGAPAVESCISPNHGRDDASSVLNTIDSLSGPGIEGTWDPSDLAFMDMLDGGMTPWTAEYLTDGHSGVDPFLFPF